MGRVVDLTECVSVLGGSGGLQQGSFSCGRPCRGWWWCGGGNLQVVRLAERACTFKAATQPPPVLLTLSAQLLADPQPDVFPALQQEVHQLHIRSNETRETNVCVYPTFQHRLSEEHYLKLDSFTVAMTYHERENTGYGSEPACTTPDSETEAAKWNSVITFFKYLPLCFSYCEREKKSGPTSEKQLT